MLISLDIETDNLSLNTNINFVGLYTVNKKGKELYKIYKLPEEADEMIRFITWLQSKNAKFVLHNGKFDTARLLYSYGLDIEVSHDTQVLTYLNSTVDELKKSRQGNKYYDPAYKGWTTLKKAAQRILGVEDWDVGLKDKTSHDKDVVAPYLFCDVKYCYQLYQWYKKNFPKNKLTTYKLILKGINAYKYIECNGLPINMEKLEETKSKYAMKQAELLAEINKILDSLDCKIEPITEKIYCTPEESYEISHLNNEILKSKYPFKRGSKYYYEHTYIPKLSEVININSADALTKILYETLELPITGYTKKGNPSTGSDVLINIRDKHPIINLILEYRMYKKALEFFESWQTEALLHKDGKYYLHSTFYLDGTVTGRTSSSDVNLQQIPRNKDLKSLFQTNSDEWEMVCLDYSQLELRFAGLVANVKNIKDSYRIGEDLHYKMASIVTGKPVDQITKAERTQAKAANFGFLYGMQAKSFVEYAKVSYGVDVSLDEAIKIRYHFFELYPELNDYYDWVRSCLDENGTITSIMRREYVIHQDILAIPWTKEDWVRPAINFPVQSAGSDYVISGLVEVMSDPILKGNIRIGATVHDSIIGLVRKNEHFYDYIKRIKSIMEHPKLAQQIITKEPDFPIVVDVEIGPLGKGVDIEEYKKKEESNE
jgi:DNA polymerase I-like protein with 3'-5' exonuclease and polymerase domains